MTEELPHIRCIECGKTIAHKWEKYQNLLSQGIPIKEALDQIGLVRYCCRFRMMNPFKVAARSQIQTDPRDNTMDEQVANLSVAATTTTVMNPIEAMTTVRYTEVPEDTGIDLPDIPEVNLPEIPGPGADIATEQPGNVIRTYQAW